MSSTSDQISDWCDVDAAMFRDRVVPPAYGQMYAKSFPRSRFEVIANCGHMPQFEQPARLLELVRAFDATPAV
jgi:pimeloyl-ACP methyl ester carboxylesterase